MTDSAARVHGAEPPSPAVSAIMSAFDAERYIAIAIESVLAQDFGDFEFLILDDGSTDRTRAIVQDYADKDGRIRLFARPHRGLVPCLNELLGEARAALVARVDADDVCHPSRFSRQVAFLRANPDHGVVGCETQPIDSAGAILPDPTARWTHDHSDMVDALASGPPLAHPTVMMRRALAIAVGGYRKAFVHAEDYDLWLRLSAVTKLANIPERLLYYRIHPDQISEMHPCEQARSAAIAWLAHEARMSGRADPIDGSGALPAVDSLDAIFGPGSSRFANKRICESARYWLPRIRGLGWDALLAEAKASPDRAMWRVAARLLLAGRLRHASTLGATLMRASVRKIAGDAA